MDAQQAARRHRYAAVLCSGRCHRPQLTFDELVAHAVVGEIPEILCGECNRMSRHARKASAKGERLALIALLAGVTSPL